MQLMQCFGTAQQFNMYKILKYQKYY
uniref:Uncharacterized protein n=1 Tax=Amphimedon queenslandica TaxID=400682 RepID=A0A1X7TEW1_AMPQE